MKRIIYTFLMGMLCVASAEGQPYNLLLNLPESGSQVHLATNSITFAPGYSYTPAGGTMFAGIGTDLFTDGIISPSSITVSLGDYINPIICPPARYEAMEFQYQWQKSTDEVNWTDISGETSVNFNPPPATERICYRRKVTYSNNTTIYSNIVYIRIENSTIQPYTTYVAQPGADYPNSTSVGCIDGEASVSPFGNATYQVPINIAPGTGGIQPDLSVVYNSMSGEGLLGIGTNLSGLSAITRVSKNLHYDNAVGAVNFDDNNDRFVLDGNRLITDAASYGSVGNVYFTESDNSTRITSKTGTDNKLWFEVETKDGRILEFGNTPDSKILSANGSVIAWKINKVRDKNNNYMLYLYNENDDEKPISEIKYTGNTAESKDPYNSIRFFYQRKTDTRKSYINGQPTTKDMLLKTIEVESENSLVRKYGFEYSYDNYTLLSKVTETGAGGEVINPTVINWGQNNTTVTPKEVVVPTTTKSNPLNKFYVAGDLNGDGLSDIACFYNYVVDEITGIQVQGIDVSYSGMGTDLITKFIRSNFYGGTASQITYNYSVINSGIIIGNLYGSGINKIITPTFFQLLIDHPYLNKGRYLDFNIKVDENHPPYKPFYTTTDTLRYSLQADSEEIPLYTTADLNNNGKMDIVIIEKAKASDGNYPVAILEAISEPETSWDGKSTHKVPVYLRTFKFSVNEVPKDIFTGDFNNDGLVDLLIITNNGIYTFANENGQFNSTRKSYSAFSNFLYSFSRQGDFNNDGIPDLLLSGDGSQNLKIAYSKGDYSFTISDAGADIMGLDDGRTIQDNSNDNCIVTDFNNDGKTDFILFNSIWEYDSHIFGGDYDFKEFKTTWYKSNGTSFIKVKEQVSTNEIDAQSISYLSGDFNGDGRMDLINYGFDCYNRSSLETKWRMYDSSDFTFKSQKVVAVTNGFKQKTEFTYRPLSFMSNTNNPDGVKFYDKGGNVPWAIAIQEPIPVISSIISPDGTGGTTTTNYTYKNAKVHLKGKGFLGFGEITANNATANKKVINTYNINPTYFFSELKQTKVSACNDALISTNNVNSTVYKSLGNKRFTIQSSSSTSTDHLKNVAVITNYEFDDWENPTKTTVNYGPKDFVVANSEGSVVTDNIYTSEGSWCNSRLSESKVTKKIGAEASYERNYKMTYDPLGRMLSKTSDPLKSKAVTETYSDFDNWGNPKKIVLSAAGLTERSTVLGYDPYGRFVEKETKEINGTKYLVERKYDGRFGVIVSEKTADGYMTTHQYDGFGKKKKSILPDGREATTEYAWVDNNTPDNAKYAVTVALAGEPTTKTIYDALGRELRIETPSFSGLTYTDKQYNAKGTLKQVSLPYFGGGTAKWTIYSYDDTYGRLTGQTFGTQTSFTKYEIVDGKYKVTTTNPANQASYKITDALGNVVKAHDNGGDIDYTYFSSGQIKDITSNGSKTEMHYDEYGRQDYLIDPDAGRVEYSYNAFGELETQKDTENPLYRMEYDVLGRLSTKTCNYKTTTYNYIDAVGTNGFGQIGSVTGPDGTTKTTYEYGNFGRISKISEMVEGQTFDNEYTYNANGKIESKIFPSGIGQRFSVTNTYDSNGYLNEVRKSDGTVIWKMLEANALGQVKQSRLGTSLTTTKTYDDTYGSLTSIQTPCIQNNQYEFNPATGNLNFRKDVNRNLTESFEYNNVNSLKMVKVNDVVKQSLEYLPNGNIDSNGKTDYTNGLGKYYYEDIPDHAVNGIDNADNIVSTDPQEITYTSFNKVDLITEGIPGEANYRTLQYLYGPDQQRRRTVLNNGSLQKTTYFIGSYEKEIAEGTTRELHYINGGDGLAAVYIKTNGTGELYYILKDHLGSVQFICNEAGQKLEEMSFDAWGRRRNPADYTDFNVAPSNYLTRGFTGHEHLDAFNLIDMNGRVYDPVLCRFLSPDPYVQMPGFTQSFNRYSYCLNNPLIFTDPSGNKWDWNWLNPLHWFETGMQAINDNTPQLRQWMSNTGIPDFNVDVTLSRYGNVFFKGDIRGQEIFNTKNYAQYKGEQDAVQNAMASIDRIRNPKGATSNHGYIAIADATYFSPQIFKNTASIDENIHWQNGGELVFGNMTTSYGDIGSGYRAKYVYGSYDASDPVHPVIELTYRFGNWLNDKLYNKQSVQRNGYLYMDWNWVKPGDTIIDPIPSGNTWSYPDKDDRTIFYTDTIFWIKKY